jgi:hypothetical protein
MNFRLKILRCQTRQVHMLFSLLGAKIVTLICCMLMKYSYGWFDIEFDFVLHNILVFKQGGGVVTKQYLKEQHLSLYLTL